MKSLGLGKSCRLNLDRQIQDVLRHGRVLLTGPLLIHWDLGACPGQQQLAIRISSRTAPAFARNRVKRVLRETFRLQRATWQDRLRLLILVRTYNPSDWKKCLTSQNMLQQFCIAQGLLKPEPKQLP